VRTQFALMELKLAVQHDAGTAAHTARFVNDASLPGTAAFAAIGHQRLEHLQDTDALELTYRIVAPPTAAQRLAQDDYRRRSPFALSSGITSHHPRRSDASATEVRAAPSVPF
jgi:precorrin-6x reductase